MQYLNLKAWAEDCYAKMQFTVPVDAPADWALSEQALQPLVEELRREMLADDGVEIMDIDIVVSDDRRSATAICEVGADIANFVNDEIRALPEHFYSEVNGARAYHGTYALDDQITVERAMQYLGLRLFDRRPVDLTYAIEADIPLSNITVVATMDITGFGEPEPEKKTERETERAATQELTFEVPPPVVQTRTRRTRVKRVIEDEAAARPKRRRRKKEESAIDVEVEVDPKTAAN